VFLAEFRQLGQRDLNYAGEGRNFESGNPLNVRDKVGMTSDYETLDAITQRILRSLDRAAGDLRRGQGLFMHESGTRFESVKFSQSLDSSVKGLLVFSLDHADSSTMKLIAGQKNGAGQLLLTGMRAHRLGLAPDTTGPDISITLPPSASLDWARFVALANWDEREAPSTAHREASVLGVAALKLAKSAPCLPALLAQTMTFGEAEALMPGLLSVEASDAGQLHHLQAVSLKRLGTTPVPLEDVGTAQFHVFRSADGHDDHLAIEIGERPPAVALPLSAANAPLVRLHSACLTGDIFHSKKCDCGPQLDAAMESMADHGHGVLLYLAQEGRNIGLTNKLRAYLLQDAGLDTVDANRALGYSDDEREYEIAAAMLRSIGYERVRLMTNNPEKISALRRAGIEVVEQVPLIVGLSPENIRYLKTKATRSGHILPDTALAALDNTLRKK